MRVMFVLMCVVCAACTAWPGEIKTLNEAADGYRGVWYMNQPSGDKYVYKYSGGLGTYCAKHKPFGVYAQKVDKTFFCYGGSRPGNSRKLLHMVSYYDHKTGTVPRPTVLLDKQTTDAHDNPVISMDDDGHIWIFSTSHGRARPSFIHKSAKPYDVSAFERVQATRLKDGKPVPIANFSYMQVWHLPGKGFVAFFTKYSWPAARTLAFMTSPDGESWSEWKRLAAIEKGHYQVSAANKTKVASTFNFHPDPKGLNWRTNLYYIESDDLGKTWRGASGHDLELPLRKEHNGALVADYRKQGLNVYMKDLRFDADGRPVILYITSKGYRAGPQNDPRTWTTARWTGKAWDIRPAFTSDNNYDMGSLMIDGDTWRIVGPTDTGPQPYNPGGEMAMWESRDRGKTWKKVKQLTTDSPRNHTYARLPVNAHRGFISLWADGHGRKPSTSTLYFADSKGTVYVLPRTMEGETARPEVLK